MTIISAQISNDLYKSLSSTAKKLDRSGSSIVRQALTVYLQKLNEEFEDYKDAIETLAQNNPKISWEEVQRNCGLLED